MPDNNDNIKFYDLHSDNFVFDYYHIILVYLNIYIYILLFLLLFNVFFLFDQKHFKVLSDLRIFSKLNFITIIMVSTLLSMAGVPPFIGFIGKLLVFIYFFYQQKYIFVLLFAFINFFTIYFYIQNLRFLVSGSATGRLPKKGFFNYLNVSLVNSMLLLSFINFFSIFYLEDAMYYITTVTLLRYFF